MLTYRLQGWPINRQNPSHGRSNSTMKRGTPVFARSMFATMFFLAGVFITANTARRSWSGGRSGRTISMAL